MDNLQQKIDWLRKLGASTEGSSIMAFTPGDRASLRDLADYLERAFELLVTVHAVLPDPDFLPTEEEETRMRSIRDRIDAFFTVK